MQSGTDRRESDTTSHAPAAHRQFPEALRTTRHVGMWCGRVAPAPPLATRNRGRRRSRSTRAPKWLWRLRQRYAAGATPVAHPMCMLCSGLGIRAACWQRVPWSLARMECSTHAVQCAVCHAEGMQAELAQRTPAKRRRRYTESTQQRKADAFNTMQNTGCRRV